MMNCKRISELASRSIDGKLSIWMRMQLWMHLSMCGLCSRFRKALVRVHEETAAKASEIESGEYLDGKLSAEARMRIQKVMDSNLDP